MAAGIFYGGSFFAVGFFGAGITPSVVSYGTGSGKRKRKKHRSQELFDDLEATIRASLVGSGPMLQPATILASESLRIVVDPRDDYAAAMRHLERLAADSRDLSRRMARLRTELEQQAHRRQQLLDEDEDETLMVLL